MGAHRYHSCAGEHGIGEVGGVGGISSSGGSGSGGPNNGSASGGANDNNGRIGSRGQTSSSSSTSPRSRGVGNVIGSPLGVLRGSTTSNNNRSSTTNATNGSPNNNAASPSSSFSSTNKSFKSTPPTSTLTHSHSLPLPSHLANEAKKAQLSSLMGLLPEANLVWVTSDAKLFLWSYKKSGGGGGAGGLFAPPGGTTTASSSGGGLYGVNNNNNISNSTNNSMGGETHGNNNQDYCSFTVPSGQCIISVGLVKPKPNVFAPNVDVPWCLVVTTPEEVILCALANEVLNDCDTTTAYAKSAGGAGGGFRHGSNSILRLIPTRFVLPTDGVPLVSICGMKNGRIFLGGMDGNLYEFSYEGNLRPYATATASGGGGMAAALMPFGGAGSSEVMEQAIDDYFDGSGRFRLDDQSTGNGGGGLVNGALLGGKRVLSALTFGSLDDSSSGSSSTSRRSRKCRKINHSSSAPSLVSSVIPGALVRVASNVFGSSLDNAAKKSGPIVSILCDEERLALYTMGSGGVVCTYDVAPLPGGNMNGSSGGSFGAGGLVSGPPRLSSVVDLPSTAKLYLSSVKQGRMYPPSTSQNIALGTITFPGGIASAQAGVGGMDGARDILKKFDVESRMTKATASTNNNGRATGHVGIAGANRRGLNNNTAGILHPVSIHLVPSSQSKSLTLVAITGGGLRYYLSSLQSSYINSAFQGGLDYGARNTGVVSRGVDPRIAKIRPGRRMIFCHIRAPPPHTTPANEGNDGLRFELAPSAVNIFSGAGGTGGGLPPGIHNVSAGRVGGGASGTAGTAAGDVVKGCYGNGVFVLALDVEKGQSNSRGGASSAGRNNFFTAPSSSGNSPKSVLGDAIVVALPDFAARVSSQPTASGVGLSNTTASNMALGGTTSLAGSTTSSAPGGISETILMPMSGLHGTSSPVLPGGRTFDVVNTDSLIGSKSSVASLFMNSETPSDAELQLGLLPSFSPQQRRQLYKKPNNGASSSVTTPVALVSTDGGRGMISSALSALSYYLRSNGGYGLEVGTVSQGSNGFGPTITYRVSFRHGCDTTGFSNSAGEGLHTSTASRMRHQQQQSRSSASSRSIEGVTNTTTVKSARLPPWLLRPSAAPLNLQTAQHLIPPTSGSSGSSSVLILNSGGLHVFTNSSVLNNLATVLLRANNIAKDALVKNFFVSYGNVEGCAMCFALATSSASNSALKEKATQAALFNAHRPTMKLTGTPSVASIGGNTLDPMAAYTFQPSFLYEGLVKLTSRLLRPFWYKPAVVVTEGRPIRTRSAYANYYPALPAKVELLLDDATLEEVRQPLALLTNLMKDKFVPAVKNVPGGTNKNARGMNDAMDVDGDEASSGGLITRAMQNQSRAAAAQRMNNNTNGSQHAVSPQELETHAFRTEDRNMHSLYRLLSRCVQLLNLISCLKSAHSKRALPEVQWGLLHGLTFYQLATTPEGQGRIETLLNALVSQGEKTLVNGMSTDGDLLADTLAKTCYLFFSSASRLTYLGFRSANDALSRSYNSPQRGVLANQAAAYLRSASRHWYSPSLVAGQLMPKSGGNTSSDDVSWEEVFMNAMEAGSPLALAADILMKLGHVEGLADVCLICAANFGGAKVPQDERKELGEGAVQGMFSWERGLYHRPTPASGTASGGVSGTGSTTTGSQAIVTGMDVTPSDALQTCHSVIFHYISKLLGETGGSNTNNHHLAEQLVATCAASSDDKFLHSLYEYLLKTNQADTALRIDSSSLEKWLLEEKKDVILLWKYYSFHGRHVLAGETMWKKAQSEEEKIPLDKRIECLTRAANSFTSALQTNNNPSSNMMRHLVGGISGQGGQVLQEQPASVDTMKKYIERIEEQLDVATIQKRVLTTVTQSQNVDLEQAKIDALAFSLVTISDIYNEFACPLNLFDVCLLVMETCRHREMEGIHKLWASIICEEILPCSTISQTVFDCLNRLKQDSLVPDATITLGEGSSGMSKFEVGEWIPRLRSRVTALGKELYGKGADYTFPVDMIVSELEGEDRIHRE